MPHLTDGNLIILYGVHIGSEAAESVPGYVRERVRICIDLHRIIINSKPDRNATLVLVVADTNTAPGIRAMLVEGGIEENLIIFAKSQTIEQTFDFVLKFIKKRLNPPYIYFVGSIWQKDIYESTIISKMKDYHLRFEGAADHRPVDVVAREKALNGTTKGIGYYKDKLRNKAVDVVINQIFPDERN